MYHYAEIYNLHAGPYIDKISFTPRFFKRLLRSKKEQNRNIEVYASDVFLGLNQIRKQMK